MAAIPIHESNLKALTAATITEAIDTMNDGFGKDKEEAWQFVFGLTQISLRTVHTRIATFLGIRSENLENTIPGNYLHGFLHDAIFRNGSVAFGCPYARSQIVRFMLADFLWRTVPESTDVWSSSSPGTTTLMDLSNIRLS